MGSFVCAANAGPGCTLSKKGDPGSDAACLRSRTCSRYTPATPIEYDARWDSTSLPCACSVPGKRPPKAKADGSTSLSSGVMVMRSGAPTAPLSTRLFRSHWRWYSWRVVMSRRRRELTSLLPSFLSVTQP